MIKSEGIILSKIKWVKNQFKDSFLSDQLEYFSKQEIAKATKFHSSIPIYKPTPLHSLSGLSDVLGVKGIYVKDESQRFGLNAFKGLGGSYAIASYFAKEFSLDLESTSFTTLVDKAKAESKVTFATATDGNHGKGLAWAAQLFGQNSKVFMPKGSSEARLAAIKELGCDACITDLNYDDTVQMVADLAEENGWILVQDTAWEGYEEVPLSIMQGYLTIIGEAMEQLKGPITHVFLQAGVGSFAASMAASIYNMTSPNSPKIIVVEPDQADCLYQSALDPNGEPRRVFGDLSTIMAGLACGEPNPYAWEVLKQLAVGFFSCEDSISATGMRILGNPVDEDPKFISGESGAVGIGLLYELLSENGSLEAKEFLGLDRSSVVLIISTEGDTDPVHYRKVVWEAIH